MRLSVVRIGNSRGIRIPKRVLEECRVADHFDLAVKRGRLILTPVRSAPRRGWDVAAARMASAGDDAPLLPDVLPDDEDLAW